VVRPNSELSDVEARATCRLKDGRLLIQHIDKVSGSRERPMSDPDLEEKVAALCGGILSSHKTRELIETCRALPALADAAALARAATP
jgi:hypothetical protein